MIWLLHFELNNMKTLLNSPLHIFYFSLINKMY